MIKMYEIAAWKSFFRWDKKKVLPFDNIINHLDFGKIKLNRIVIKHLFGLFLKVFNTFFP